MPAILIEHPTHRDASGNGFLNGKLYIGTNGADPILNPKAIFSDRALTVALTQPQILDVNGRTATKVWTSGIYSIQIDTSADVQQFQDLDAGESATVGNIPIGSAVGTNSITGTGTPTQTDYVDDVVYIYEQPVTNTGPVDVNWDGIGSINVRKNLNQVIAAGEFQANQKIMLVFNSGENVMEWINHNVKTLHLTKGANIASAATIAIPNDGNFHDITGNTGPVTSITGVAGTPFYFRTLSNPTFTSGANLILPSDINLVAKAGDIIQGWMLTDTQALITGVLGAEGVMPGNLARDLSTVTVTNTTTETSIFSFSIPANTLGPNRLLRVNIGGTYLNNSGGIRTLTIRLKYGATTVASFARTITEVNPVAGFIFDLYLCGDDSNSAQKGWFNFATVDDSQDLTFGTRAFGIAAEDSTGALTFDVTVQHGFANANLTFIKEAAFARVE